MKVLHVVNVRWYNATAWYAVTLARGMKESGNEVIMCGLPGKPPMKKSEEYGLRTFEAEFNSSSPLKLFQTMKQVKNLLNTYKPDVVVCHRGEFFWYFAIKKLFKSPPWKLVRVRGDIRPPKGGFFNRLMHGKCTDKIVVSGNFIKQRFIDILGTESEKIKVLFGGVDFNIFRKDKAAGKIVRKELGFSDDDFVVGVVGRFDPIKGHDVLIKAVGKCYQEGMANIRLVIAGFDAVSRTDDITNAIKEAGIEEITTITGFREDIEAVINSFSLGVVSSLGSEAICRVGLEIMACEVPLVVSDTGVLPEIVPVENVYSKHSYTELAEKIMKHSSETASYSIEEFTASFMDFIS